MIIDRVEFAKQYAPLSERLKAALELLAETDFSSLPDGKYEVDGDNLFYSIMTYRPKPENLTPESHVLYTDIQYVIEGEEYIGVAPLSCMKEQVRHIEGSDLYLWNGPCDNIRLSEGCFAVLFPQDAHAPGIAAGEPAQVRKVVVKVRN